MDAQWDLRLFIKLYSPNLEDPAQLEELCDALDESLRTPLLLLVEAPPRHYKTVTLLHHAARILRYWPGKRCAYSTYAGGLAFRKSRIARDIAQRSGAIPSRARAAWQGRVFDPASAVSHWQTHGDGSFVAGGRKGNYVGEGFHWIHIDDPFRDRAESESPVIQEAVYEDLFQGTMFTRLEPGASMCISHQPWNDRDLIARLIDWAKEQGLGHVRHVRMPAVRDAVYDQQGKIIAGVPLLPQRYGIPELQRIQVTVGTYNFESQYQCNRVPRGQRVFTEPQRYVSAQIDHAVIAASCDPGVENNEKKDPSAFVVGAGYIDDDGLVCVDVLLAYEKHGEIPDTVDELEALNEDWECVFILEEVSAFKALSQVARRLDLERVKRRQQAARLRLISWTPRVSKFVRSLPTAAAVRYGRVRVPRDAWWVPAFLKQLQQFTGRPGGKDNLVDALTQLHDYFEKTLAGGAARARTGGAREIAAGTY